MKRKLIARVIVLVLATMMIIPAFVAPAQAVTLDKSFTIYLVPNTHLDTAWQSPFPQIAYSGGNNGVMPMFTVSTTALNDSNYAGQLRFTTSASAHLKMLKDYYNTDNPTANQRLWELTKSLVDKGQLDLAGGQIVEPDLNVPSGEALVRQSLYAQHFFLANFTRNGQPYKSLTGMVPDVFGFSGQLPQILMKSEMKYFVTSKVNWNNQDGGGAAIGSSYEHYRTAGGNGSRGRDSDIMTWRALDGESTVLANFLQADYNNTSPNGQIQNAFDANWVVTTGNDASGFTNRLNFHGGVRSTGIKKAVIFYGGGDFGQGMTTANSGATSGGNSFRHHEYVATQNPGSLVNVKTSTITQFFEELVATENLERLNTTDGNFIDGEMYAEFHRGTYTTWARLKKYNRENEILGESAEKAATIGFYTNSVSTNSQQRIEDGWYKILINQMHDVLPGSALAWQYYLTFNHHELAKNLFNGVRDNALAALAYRANTNTVGKPVFVYNDLSWARSGEVTVRLQYDADTMPAGGVVVYDGDNPIYPTKVVRNEGKKKIDVTFNATAVPAIGYKVFDVRAEEPGARTTPLSFDPVTWTISNDNLRVKFNPATGYISSLQTIVGGAWREMFAQGVGTEGGELHVYQDCDATRPSQNFDQWNVNRAELDREPWYFFQTAPVSMQVTCNTPEKVTISVVKVWNGQQVTQDFSVLANSDRVDVHLAADWYQMKRLLKVSFPIAADNYNATFETSFGAVQRPTRRDNVFGYARFEVPVHKWSDVTDNSGNWGVSILNDAKYGNDVLRRTVNGVTFIRSRITVARVPQAQAWAGNSTYPPVQPYVIDAARHEFNYSIAPHAGSWEDARTVNKAAELNYPMKAFEAAKGPSNGLGSAQSFASSDKSNVIITALKNQYDEPNNKNKIVVRVYESSGKPTNDVTLTLPGNILSAKEVNMLEHDYDAAHGYSGTSAYTVKPLTVSGNTVKFNIKKYEALTIECVLEPSALAALALPQQSITLAYNSRGVTPNSNRTAGYIAGTGASTSNTGLSMPQEHWPANNQIDYQGIKFNLGAPTANNFLNGTSSANSTISVTPAQGYSKLYIVGVSVPSSGTSVVRNNPYQRDPAVGTFTVNYATGAPTTKEIAFNSWRTELSGWNRIASVDDQPYVYDTVAHFNGHYHLHTGNNGEMQEADNYLFLYAIDIDSTRNVSSIQIPISNNIKIAAMTLAAPVDGFGIVYESDTTVPETVQNVKARYDITTTPIYSNINVTWDASPDAASYSVHRGTSASFATSGATQIATVPGTSYTDPCPTISVAEMNAGLTYYYKIIANGETGIPAQASNVSNGLVPAYVDYALNIITAENTARVVANRQQSSEQAFKAINGVLSGTSNKWCATGVTASNPARWAIDLTGSASAAMPKIEFVRINHSVEGAAGITGAFTLSYATATTAAMSTTGIVASDTPNGFTRFANVTGNSTLITTHMLPGDGVNLRYLLLVVTNPANGGDANNATRIYEVYAVGRNMNFIEPTSMAEDIKITQSPVLGGDKLFSQAHFAADYKFYNADPTVTEDVAKTEYRWSKKLSDGTYVPLTVPSAKEVFVPMADVNSAAAIKCEITVWDSKDEKGMPVSAEIITNDIVEANVLRGASVVSQITGNTTASALVDGNRLSSSKWDYITGTNNANAVPGPWTAVLDMGSVREFNRLMVYHANAFPAQSYDENPLIATYDFDLGYSLDNVTWVTKEIRANVLPITAVDLGGIVSARYVRISVITPNNGGTTFDTAYKSIRIAELEAILDSVTSLSPTPATLYSGANKVAFAAAKGSTVDVKSYFLSNPALSGNVVIYAAAYSSRDALLSLGTGSASFAGGALSGTISDFVVPAGAAKLKVFYWADGSMVPISEAVLFE